MKKVLSLFLSLVMLVSITVGMNITADAETYSGKCGDDVYYIFDVSTGGLKITGEGPMNDYTYNFNGNISTSPFSMLDVKYIIIESGITSVGRFAFADCEELMDVTIPNSVIEIKDYAFKSCLALNSIIIPDGVTNIGDQVFNRCENLVNIKLPDSVINIGWNSFNSTAYFRDESNWDNGVLYIDNCLIAAKQDTIEKNYIVKDGTTAIAGIAFSFCNLSSVIIPDSVKGIGNNAFQTCEKLTNVMIGKGIEYIGALAFSKCKNADIYIKNTNCFIYNTNSTLDCHAIFGEINSTAQKYADKYNKKFIHYPHSYSSVVTQPNCTEKGYTTYTCVGCGDSYVDDYVNELGHKYVDNLCTVCGDKLPIDYDYNVLTDNTIEIIGYAGSDEDVIIPTTIYGFAVTSIGSSAFQNCTSITSLTIPDNITNIGSGAFSGCTGLVNLTMPVSLKTDDADSFEGCTKLSKIRLTKGNGVMADWSVDYQDSPWYVNKNSVREIILDEGITNISESAFCDCSNLIRMIVPSSVTSIGRYAYLGCTNLRNLTIINPYCVIPDSVNTIDKFITIYGYDGSTAESYATKYSRDFVSLGGHCNDSTTVIDEAVPSTCTSTGLTQGSHCSACGKILVAQEVIEKIPHTEEIDEAVQSTCTSTGLTQGSHCSVCSEIIIPQEIIEKKAHTEVIDDAVRSTCTSTGLTQGSHCSVCGEIIIPQEVVEKKAHTEVIDDAVRSTCSQTGLTQGSHCSVCGEIIIPQEVVEKKAHTEVIDDAVLPTCKPGLTQGSHCSVCGEVIIPQEIIAATGKHTTVIDKEIASTCTSTGLTKGAHCIVCGEVLFAQTVTDKKEHNYEINISPGNTKKVCADCGYELELDTDYADNFKPASVSLSLESDITMRFKVPRNRLDEFESPYMEFTRNGKTVVSTDYYDEGEYYVFEYYNIAPQAMNDTVTAVLYGVCDEKIYFGDPVDFSVSQYAYGMLEMHSENEKLRTLLVDLLNYGAAAQIYKNYKTENLVNANLTNVQKSWASARELELVSITDKNYEIIENAAADWISVGMQLDSYSAVRFKFTADSIDDIRVDGYIGDEYCAWYYDDFADNGDGTYTLLVYLNAHQLGEAIYVTVMQNDKAISNTIRYSAESYAKQVQDAMPDSKLRDLTDAMMRYGRSALNYVK